MSQLAVLYCFPQTYTITPLLSLIPMLSTFSSLTKLTEVDMQRMKEQATFADGIWYSRRWKAETWKDRREEV